MTVSTKPGMKDQTSSNIARDGAAKRPQTSFPTHTGMKSQVEFRGAAPSNPGTGMDAGSPNVADPSNRGKSVQTDFPAKWGMRDANGKSVNGNLGKQVLSEAALTGRPS